MFKLPRNPSLEGLKMFKLPRKCLNYLEIPL